MQSRGHQELHMHQLISTHPHPNVMALLHGQALPTGDVCLVMEYGEGGDLLEHVMASPGGLEWPEAVHLAVQLMDAIAHLHHIGFVHRYSTNWAGQRDLF